MSLPSQKEIEERTKRRVCIWCAGKLVRKNDRILGKHIDCSLNVVGDFAVQVTDRLLRSKEEE